MSKIRKHLEDSLLTAQHAYDDAFYGYSETQKKLKQLTEEVARFKYDMENTDKDMNYYQELLDELNEKS